MSTSIYNAFNFVKGQASSLVNALSYGLTHLDQYSTAGDVIVVQHPDGTLHSTPFNVRFGKISVPRPSTKIVRIEVNGEPVTSVMKLKSDGTAYFVESSGSGADGGFPISPSQSPISPPRSPTAQSSQPPNSPPLAADLLGPATSAASETSSISTSEDHQKSLQEKIMEKHANLTPEQKKLLEKQAQEVAELEMQKAVAREEVVTVDEGSALEIAKQNPEIRDLVTSLVGESRGSVNNDSTLSSGGYRPPNNSIVSPNSGDLDASADVITPKRRANTKPVVTSEDDGGTSGSTTSPETQSANGSFSGKPGGLRLSRFASSNNVNALNDLIATDDNFAAFVKEIKDEENKEEYIKNQQKAAQHPPLQLAPSASRLSDTSNNVSNASPGDAEMVLNQTNNNMESTTTNAALDTSMPDASTAAVKNQTPEIVTNQNAESPNFRNNTNDNNNNNTDTTAPINNNNNINPQLPAEQIGSQLIDDDEFIDDSSDEDYDYFLQSAPAQQQQQQQQNNKRLVNATSGDATSAAAVAGGGGGDNLSATSSIHNEEIVIEDPLDSTTGVLEHAESGKFLGSAAAAAAAKKNHHAPFHATISPGHNELAKLNLKDGANIVKFIVYSQTLTRTTEVEARIFLWPYTAKVVISDIDGTVTKSDVMGHLSAILRWDWTHPGLCSLYTNIAKNEYKFLYLTARSLSQTSSTRTFLEGVAQEGQKLPDGPVFTATEKLFAALTQEVLKRSHIFKTECLTAVRQVFPKSLRHPLYAGFGNRIGDSIAYENVGIPLHKIFIIDESSVVHVCKVKQTYRDLSHLVDMTFPPISGKIPVQASQLPIHYSNVTVVNGGVRNSASPSFSVLGQANNSTSSLNSSQFQHQGNNNNTTSPTLTTSHYNHADPNNSSNHDGTISPQSSSTAAGFFPSGSGGNQNSGGQSGNGSNQVSPSDYKQQQQQQQSSASSTQPPSTSAGTASLNSPLPPPMLFTGNNNNNSAGMFSSTISGHHHHHQHQHHEDDMMEEKVDFNDWNFWRTDPTSVMVMKPKSSKEEEESKKKKEAEQAKKEESNNNNKVSGSNSVSSRTATPSRPKKMSGLGLGGEDQHQNGNEEPAEQAVMNSPNPDQQGQLQQPAASSGWFSSFFGGRSKSQQQQPTSTASTPRSNKTDAAEQQQGDQTGGAKLVRTDSSSSATRERQKSPLGKSEKSPSRATTPRA